MLLQLHAVTAQLLHLTNNTCEDFHWAGPSHIAREGLAACLPVLQPEPLG